MSYNLLKSISVISFGLVVGYNTGRFFETQTVNRKIASYPIGKMSKVHNSEPLFDIKADTDELSKTEDGVSILKIQLHAFKDFPAGLVYTWKLPHETDLVEGALDGQLEAFSMNQNKELVLKVKGFSKQSKKFINFIISGAILEKPIHREVLISSRIEDSHEYAIQQRELKKTKDTLNKLSDSKSKNKFSPDRVVQ